MIHLFFTTFQLILIQTTLNDSNCGIFAAAKFVKFVLLLSSSEKRNLPQCLIHVSKIHSVTETKGMKFNYINSRHFHIYIKGLNIINAGLTHHGTLCHNAIKIDYNTVSKRSKYKTNILQKCKESDSK